MKPIMLRLGGLQSYREVQEVDFARLCEAGVFGIFGPTGSGKSSILDAVTLALYGKVERALNGTQGIMNQMEKALTVSFTFELSGGGETRRYRVERQFKRGGEVSVNNTLSRFIEVAPQGELVLADKLADVTRCVEDRIGLTMQDFTRAVVLPQGKFAEFLSLTGKDRRQMLQRLFSLERYGDTLSARLGARAKAAEAAFAQAAAEQQGLGDASAAAVEAAAAARREAGEARAAAGIALAGAEAEHAEALQVRERQEELRAKEALQAKLQADTPRIAALEQELRRLEAAERLLPALAARDAAEAEQRRLAARREEAGLAHAARQEAAAGAAVAWAAAQQQAAVDEPRLALRLEQLAQAQRLEREAAQLAAGIAEGGQRLTAAEGRLRELGEQAAKAQETLTRGEARQSELKSQLKVLELQPEERQRWMSMSRRQDQLDSVRAQVESAGRELGSAREKQVRMDLAITEAAEGSEKTAAELKLRIAVLSSEFAELSHFEAYWRHKAEEIPAMIDQERARERELSNRQLALQLSEGLRHGDACPVCGSTAHPALSHLNEAETRDDNLAEAEQAIRDWERLRTETGALLLRLSPLLLRGERLLDRLREAADGAIETASPEDRHGSSAGWSEAAAASAEESVQVNGLGAVKSGLASAIDVLTEAERNWNLQEQQTGKLLQTLAESERRKAVAAAELQAQQALLETAIAKQDEWSKSLEGLLGQWREAFGDLDPYDAGAAIAAWEQREQDAHKAKEGLERSVSFMEEKAALLQETRHHMQEAKLESVESATRLESQRLQLEEKASQLRQWTDGQPAAALIAAAESELALVRERLISCSAAREEAAAALQEAAERRTASAEAEQSAMQRFEALQQQWAEALQPSGFGSAEEVNALRPLLPQKGGMAAEAERHREAEKLLAAQAAMLREGLNGRAIDDEQWQACAQKLAWAKQLAESAIQTAAKAERALEELTEKHERWTRLEAVRSGMQALCTRLGQLQTVFRGNAFVEYVAEEQLVQVCRAASERLGFLTKRRYALEVDSGGGFVIRDDANGGVRRPVGTLSGGETFLASLALALALSAQIQLRGRYPLQFFFLDEGFGTLDPELLETVITALEKLHTDKLSVGVISHVPELRARLARRLIVTPAEPSGSGSSVQLETL